MASRRNHEHRSRSAQYSRAAHDKAEVRLSVPRSTAYGRPTAHPAASPRPGRDGFVRGGVRQHGHDAIRLLAELLELLDEGPGCEVPVVPHADLLLVGQR